LCVCVYICAHAIAVCGQDSDDEIVGILR